jgi:two-component system chemotaxis sensor kinase CheA
MSFAEELEATFLEELDERLRSMEAALVRIERPTDPKAMAAALESFGRDAHSLKGGAQLVGRSGLARIAHALETSLERAHPRSRDGQIETEPLFEALEAMERLRRSGEDTDLDVDSLVDRLGAGGSAHPGPLDGPRSAGAQTPPVIVDVTSEPVAPPARPSRPERGAPDVVPTAAEQSTPVATDRADRLHRSVRVSTERLDALMNHASDLAAVREAGARRATGLRNVVRSLDADEGAGAAHQLRLIARSARTESQRLAAISEALESDLLGLRMVPLESLFREFPRLVRDLARATGKEVRLESLGWATPMDRDLVERLRDPVMHLLRNAVDHGIEPPEQRLAVGKPAMGTIILEARARAGGITIEVRDDGAGIDLSRVRSRAEETGLLQHDTPDAAVPTLGLIFEPGFSTAHAVTEVSGRGIGLDVVRDAIDAIGGTVEVTSERGLGMRFVLRVPLTLASTTVLVVLAHGRRYAVPLSAVERATRLDPATLSTLGGQTAIDVPGGSVVLADLATLMGAPSGGIGTASSPGTALVLATARGRAGILVDGVESELNVVLRGFGSVLGTPALLSGAALIDEDSLLLVLDADALVERTLSGSVGTSWSRVTLGASPESSHERPADRSLRVLVVDDSITTRTLEKNILAAAGFEVILAVDGQDALRAIRASRPDVVISDVDMPVLDGIALTEQLRASEDTRDLPVILVTSLDAPDQRDRGLIAGADAYLTKQSFDQRQLLETIRELVG